MIPRSLNIDYIFRDESNIRKRNRRNDEEGMNPQRRWNYSGWYRAERMMGSSPSTRAMKDTQPDDRGDIWMT